MKYRPEIDGLRALAVVPVMLFHAGIPHFEGGFIGVDVFFVISGYLITTIILEDLKKDRFSLITFYERRARRILPALFLVIACSLPFAWSLMLPTQLRDFSTGTIAVILFVSNVLFWRTTNYFSPASEINPLLHTWSLAVEEQFYLIFPVFLFVMWRYLRTWAPWAVALVAFSSLLLCEWAVREVPTAAFYLSPSRAWELLAGSLVAFSAGRTEFKKSELFSLLGLSAIVIPIFAFKTNTPFPGHFALFPVVGTALLILFAGSTSTLGQLLASRPLVWTGLISYSAYLWHQPLLAFARLWDPSSSPSPLVMITLCAIALVLAALSWRYVEQPFRTKGRISRTQVFTFATAGAVLFLALGVSGILTNGYNKARFSANDRAYLDTLLEDNPSYVRKRFNERLSAELKNERSERRVLLVGDSYAQDLMNALSEAGLSKLYEISTFTVDFECGNLFVDSARLLPHQPSSIRARCARQVLIGNEHIQRQLKNADEVWLASAWQDWQIAFIPESLRYLAAHTEGQVLLFGRKKFPAFIPTKFKGLSAKERAESTGDIDEATGNQLALAMRIVPAATYVDVQAMLCNGSHKTCSLFDENGMLKTFDGSHLTHYGASVLGEGLKGRLLDHHGSSLN